ncbi:hypothetical protein conserved [Leishmania donovani]|uniref:Hypothetical_protein_conserved n=1 Tax=Leishmania donovani TaxID=5661 RepID=A0A6J8FJ40_LEIDO|nr:hypothetical protein conserved [Leishmania donovani]VDZ47501.1 hypothetical_protein_conserved [Leishmania donovani]
MAETAGVRGRRTFMGRQRSQHEVQTEASFVPGCNSLEYAYDPLASEQYASLVELRQMIHSCLTLVAGDVYDVVSFKDILYHLESEMPSSLPVTDLLLLSSRLFRRTAELGRLLSCFFGVVFADDHNDEHFRFAEVRLLQREIRELKRQLSASEEERRRLKEMLDNVGQVAYDHGRAVELLETHNKVLKKQSTALEDQMALLFHQLNSGLEGHCKAAYQQVTGEMMVQESLNPARITFRQTMDSLSEQLRGSRGLITDVREVLLSCSQGRRTGEAYTAVEPTVRFKLKMLEANFQQLMGRFTAVKDTVVETAQELMNALQERKKILCLSFQHIRLYDLQNAKLRNARAILAQLQHNTSEVVRRIRVTFPSGNLTSVDRFGNISTQRWHGGYTLATLRGYKLTEQQQQGEGEMSEFARSSTAGPSLTAGASRMLPGLTESQIMAAESEMAVIDGTVHSATPVALALSPGLRSMRVSHSGVTPPPLRTSAPPSGGGSKLASARGSSSTTGMPVPVSAPTSARSDDPDVLPFETVSAFLDLMHDIDDDMDELQGALVLDDEMGAFLKMLTLSASTTPRADALEIAGGLTGRAALLEQQEYNMETALQPTGGRPGGTRGAPSSASVCTGNESFTAQEANSFSSLFSKLGSPSTPSEARGGSRAENASSEAVMARQAVQLQRQQKQIAKMQEDFTSKVGFLRQVYEARIGDLEVRETTVSKRLGLVGGSPFQRGAGDSGSARSSPGVGKGEEEPRVSSSPGDKERLTKLRKEWRQAKGKLQPNRKLREATAEQLQLMQKDEKL